MISDKCWYLKSFKSVELFTSGQIVGGVLPKAARCTLGCQKSGPLPWWESKAEEALVGFDPRY